MRSRVIRLIRPGWSRGLEIVVRSVETEKPFATATDKDAAGIPGHFLGYLGSFDCCTSGIRTHAVERERAKTAALCFGPNLHPRAPTPTWLRSCIEPSDVNRHRNGTPDRRPIGTPVRSELCRSSMGGPARRGVPVKRLTQRRVGVPVGERCKSRARGAAGGGVGRAAVTPGS